MMRRTSMLFVIYPPITNTCAWMEYVNRFHRDVVRIMQARIERKTPRDRMVGVAHIHYRHLKPKWHDKSGITGVLEGTADWMER